MASSENQGLQIALIIFVMLTILLSVTTFMFFREYQEADTRSVADKKSATDANQNLRKLTEELEATKEVVGIGRQATLSELRQTLTDDMAKFAATAPPESQFYHPALEFLAKTLAEKTDELVAARLTIQQERDERKKVEDAKQTQVVEAEKNALKAIDDLANAKKAFDDDRKRMLDENEDLKRQIKEKGDAFTELADAKKKQEDVFAAENKKLESRNKYLNERNLDLDPTSDSNVADGKIVWVDQRARTAYINVGQSDGLRRQTMFSVVAGDDNVGRDQKTKGRLEVTEILAPHFAVARIIEDKMTDPMVEGDQIFTPLWSPGRGEGFGIIGLIDLDQDGVDDREMVRDLIRMSGGHVDAEDTKDGKQVGELNINTRYLVEGEPPVGDLGSKAYTKMLNDAGQLGVRKIPVARFLDMVGWKNQKQTLLFGRRGNANDVPPERRDGGSRQSNGVVAGGFKIRRPFGRRGLGGVDAEGTAPKPKSAYGK